MNNTENLQILIKMRDEASAKINNVTNSIGGIAKGFIAGAIATDLIQRAFGFLSNQVTSSIAAFNESERVTAQMNAVLTSTGHAAGITAVELQNLAKGFQQTTVYEDDVIMSAQNLMLTFTSIGKEVFPQAIEAVLNMSTSMGQDLKSSVLQLGKALQDPTEGLSALRRVGVNFTDSQQNLIAKMVETGKVTEAQKMILAELAREFGGSATAQAKTFEGQLLQLKNQMGEFSEEAGHGVTASLSALLSSFKKVTGGMSATADTGKNVFKVMSFITQAAANTAAGIRTLAASFVILSSYIAQGIAMLNGFDEAEKQFWSGFRDGVVSGAQATIAFADQLREENAKVLSSWDDMTEVSRLLKSTAPGAYEDTADEAVKAADKIKEANKAIEGTKEKINELIESHQKEVSNTRQSYAKAIVDQEKNVKDLKKQIREEEDEDKKAELKKQYEQEKQALDSKRILLKVFSDEVAEERRRNSLTAFEREVEDITRRMVEQQKEYDKKMELLQKELAENEEKRAKLSVIEQGITSDLQAELATRYKSVTEYVEQSLTLFEKMQKAKDRAISGIDRISDMAGTSAIKKAVTKKVNDAIIKPTGEIISTHPRDWLIATQNPMALATAGGGSNITINIGNVNGTDRDAARQLADMIAQEIKYRVRL